MKATKNPKNTPFSVNELKNIELVEPFKFTKDYKTMKIKTHNRLSGFY